MVKQVIIVNKGLGMSAGKMAAQVAHASVGAFERAKHDDIARWHEFGVTKIVLQADDAEALTALKAKAKAEKLPHFLVADAGRTEIEAGSITALGIGPAPDSDVDKVTGDLKLYS